MHNSVKKNCQNVHNSFSYVWLAFFVGPIRRLSYYKKPVWQASGPRLAFANSRTHATKCRRARNLWSIHGLFIVRVQAHVRLYFLYIRHNPLTNSVLNPHTLIYLLWTSFPRRRHATQQLKSRPKTITLKRMLSTVRTKTLNGGLSDWQWSL